MGRSIIRPVVLLATTRVSREALAATTGSAFRNVLDQLPKGSSVNANKIAALTAIALATPLCHAMGAYSATTAPDAVSREVLSQPLHSFEEGAVTPQDIPGAIHRNLPLVVEQAVAGMRPSKARAWLDGMSDFQLQRVAQLYVKSNADTKRAGKLLQVLAARLDGARLGRLSKFFGSEEVALAVSSVAPEKMAAFAANTSSEFVAPAPEAVTALGTGRGVIDPMWTPAISMTLEELYDGFYSMQVGSMATTAALYETASYAGTKLVPAFGYGYAFGTGLSYVMENYMPTFYYNTFVPAVGNAADYLQSVVDTTYDYSPVVDLLGPYQGSSMPVMGVPADAQGEMLRTGGDYQTEVAYHTYYDVDGHCSRPSCNER
jgi:hypothetical protein